MPGSNSVWQSIRFGHWPSYTFRWRLDVRRGTWRWLFSDCTGRFSEDHSGEVWIICAKCFKWEHTVCAGVGGDCVCELCQG
jgi:hypothetical protein